ncbi:MULTISPECIES: methyl-accepting chemotaxis protein [Asticcacaulis]|uniref:methyl-accepting chemotaxis protein n=1 Tax=Asticcacaulis TaxID=76890 RepID=UPI001AE4BAF4|nr:MULTISPECIES: HAMP domain-containing methyl-accepting chemotaxis protein [Asticcacaulis]MBP2159531.1 methyl-accepting chemotaxis protein [Asticcacaulis solisilvae]MDR6800642.1 methyl-accepting chemotaxis protein [Asticcacaulis sp. BE141]
MNLRTKFVGLGATCACLVMTVVGVNWHSSNLTEAHIRQSSTITVITQRHMEGDMMHDAMNSDVLGAMVAQSSGNVQGVTSAQEEFRAHAANFRSNLEKNRAENVPEGLKKSFDATLQSLEAYTSAGETALAGIAAGSGAGAMADFEARFSAMEASNEALSGEIDTWMKKADAHAVAAGEQMELIVSILSALAIFGVVLMAWLLWRDILKPLNAMAGTITSIAKGDTDINVDYVRRGDEIGILARATETLRGNAREAFMVNQMVQGMPTSVMSVDVRDNLRINYANTSTLDLLKRLDAFLPVKGDQVIGQSIDIFHKHPEHQRRLLSTPQNLPHRANINLGGESIDLQISAVRDQKGEYVAAMLVWELVTAKTHLTQEFETNVQQVVSSLAASAEELSRVASSMTDELKRSAGLAVSASSAASQTTSNVHTVAAAAEELSASIREISSQIQVTNNLVRESYTKVQNADLLAQKLAQASERVNEVTAVIAGISSQINLLALNATIESARAGDAGRGFAVVAGEVKNLANQTNRSIGEINSVIEEMRLASSDIIDALSDIKSSVDNITQATTSVASAVEEQSATTQDIARNMALAAEGTQMISDNLHDVSSVTTESGEASAQLYGSSQDLSEQANVLRGRVADFLTKMNTNVEAA